MLAPVSTLQEYKTEDDNMLAFTLQACPGAIDFPTQLSKGTDTGLPSELKMRTSLTPAGVELTLTTVQDASC
jgi:hypothetical protein